jgi:hypothetical protein
LCAYIISIHVLHIFCTAIQSCLCYIEIGIVLQKKSFFFFNPIFFVDDFRNDLGYLIRAFRLNAIQYKTMMISSGILRRRGNDYRVNNNLLQELQRQLQPDIPIQITRCLLQHRYYHNYFLSVRGPVHLTPNLQLQNKHCIQRNPQQIVGYDRILNAV